MTTTPTPIGAKVRRTRGRFAGSEGIVVALDQAVGTVFASFALTGDHRITRQLHRSELELVDLGPHPIPAGTAGVI
jgi:hypothetical protein